MMSEVLERVEYSLSLANQSSKREGRWSLPAEVIPVLETEYGYHDVKYQSVGNALKELLAQDRVEFKKPDLWRVSKGGGIGGSNSTPTNTYRSPDPYDNRGTPVVVPVVVPDISSGIVRSTIQNIM
jgi:hypothetical protein